MAAGVPTVVADRASLPEVTKDGALHVPPHDEEAVSAALVRVLENRSVTDPLRERGRRVARQYSWRRAAEEHVRVYRTAFESPPRSLRATA